MRTVPRDACSRSSSIANRQRHRIRINQSKSPTVAEGCAYTIYHIHNIHRYINTALFAPRPECCCINTSPSDKYTSITVDRPLRAAVCVPERHGTCCEVIHHFFVGFIRFHSVSGGRREHLSLKSPVTSSQCSCYM